jgi:undecaprenyl-diphosphatase
VVTGSRFARRLRDGPLGRALTRVAARSGLPAAVVLVVAIAAVTIAAAGLAFTKILDSVMERDGVAALDPDIHRWFVGHRTPCWNDLFRAITWAGSMVVVVPLAIVVVVLLLRARHPVLAGGVVLAIVGAAVTVSAIKPIVGRARPPLAEQISSAGGFAFPSGHSATAAATAGVFAWVATRFVHRRGWQVVIWAGAVVWSLAVGTSRAYLGVHWPSDVLSGWFVGAAWVAASIGVCTLVPALDYRRRMRPHAPDTP